FEERRIAVVLFPAPSGNAGCGYLQPAGGGGRTPTESAVLVLEPGEDVPVEGILATLPADGPTTAEVVYTASVTVLEDEEWVEAREAQVELVTDVDAGIGDRHSVRLDAEPEVAETGLICPDNPGLFGFVDHVSCRFARGVLTFGQGMGDLAGLGVQGGDEPGGARGRLLAWTGG